MKRANIAVFFAAATFPTLAHAEYRNYDHAGCTKDGVKVTQQIIWNCEGSCSNTPLKATIMREAKASRAAFPKVVANLTRSQVASGAHGSILAKQANLTTRLISSHAPKFGGKC